MNVIDILINKITSFEKNINSLIETIVKDNENIVLDLNTQSQLFEKGIDSEGTELNTIAPYRPLTVSIKKIKGQPTSRVTLRDEGDFHRSFFIKYSDTGFSVDASDEKTEALLEKYGDEVLGLTHESLEEILRNYIIPGLIEELKNDR